MAAFEINSHGIRTVETFSGYLQQLLHHADTTVKPMRSIEPPLNKSDFDEIYGQITDIFAYLEGSPNKLRQYAIVETAVRDVFGGLIATTQIDSPEFTRVWNLFDILSIFSDHGQCDPLLLFWLIEELLDSQTIAGCRKVFDYLESRRERITVKHFHSTKLVILRSCNDLLRRLSRAQDTPFCGRVFIFLFQVFPLGDKSSVNLRGEYHVENVTTYDETSAPNGENEDTMEVDSEADSKAINFDTLYPVFWSLQESFSQPKKLFDKTHFAQFKSGLEASLAVFHQLRKQHGSGTSRQMDDAKRGVKRKREKEADDELANTYNPKYLTSRDLFELETKDLTFRRHFLLQALIIMEFLLSLSAKAKEKLATANTQNKSVIYSDQVLSEEDTAWATKMKHDITEHIKNSNEDGAYFFRMVDTILSRDKNWVRWKVESCPPIERPGVSAEMFASAKEGAQRAFAKHRRRSNAAMGSFSLDFLNDNEDPKGALEQLKQPDRYTLPELSFFEKEIANEDFEIEMPDSDQSKMLAEERKASKTWRALRIVRQTKLATFDKIDDDNKIGAIYTDDAAADDEQGATDDSTANGASDGAASGDVPLNRDSLPQDTRPVVLAGPTDVGKAALGKALMERNPGVFGLVLQHTTKPSPTQEQTPETGASQQYHFVDAKAFNVMLDGDKLLCFGETGGFMYGTHKAQLDLVTASGKVPLLLMNYESVESAKENGLAARYVFVQPPSIEALEAQLKARGLDDADVQGTLESARAVLDKIGSDQESGLFDTVLVNDGLESTCEKLETYVYGAEEEKQEKKEEDEKMDEEKKAESPEKKKSDEEVVVIVTKATEDRTEKETEDTAMADIGKD